MEQPIVTQQELDALLTTLGSYRPRRRATGRLSITLYDFRDAFNLSAHQVNEVARDCERLGRVLNRTLGVYLNGPVTIEYQALNRMKSEQYIGALPDDGIVTVLPLVPYAPPALLHVDTTVLYTALEMMMGGSARAPEIPRREPTPLEITLLQALAKEVMATWQSTTRFTGRLLGQVGDIYYRPATVNVHNRHEWVLCASYRVQIASQEGFATLALPCATMRELLKPPANQQLDAAAARRRLKQSLLDCPVSVAATLGHTRLSSQQLAALAPGQVIKISAPPRLPRRAIAVSVAGIVKFTAASGVQDGHLAVQIIAPAPGSD